MLSVPGDCSLSSVPVVLPAALELPANRCQAGALLVAVLRCPSSMRLAGRQQAVPRSIRAPASLPAPVTAEEVLRHRGRYR